MRPTTNIALGATLCISLLGTTLSNSSASASLASNSLTQRNATKTERTRVKHGSEVANRVRQLQKHNSNLRRALADFEKNERRNGHKPKVDESYAVTFESLGNAQSSGAIKNTGNPDTPFRKVSLTPQTTDYSGYGVEMIFIPAYSAPGEWQGTVLFNKFDPAGAYLGQYVADVVMGPDASGVYWEVVYEASYEDGQTYLGYGNPGFELGTPMGLQDPAMSQPLVSSVSKSELKKVSFAHSPQRIMYPRTSPRVRWVMKCTAIGSVAGAAGCGVVSLAFAGMPFVPCAVGGATTALTACTLTAIFGG